jgi:hypothetical protein
MGKSGMVASLAILTALIVSGLSCASSKIVPATTEYYKIGQYVQTSKQMLNVTSADRTASYNRAGLKGLMVPEVYAPAGTVFIIINATVFNSGHSALHISRSYFAARDSEGRDYAPRSDYLGYHAYPNKNLAPGDTATGIILFQVPNIATGLEVSCVVDGTPPMLAVWQLSF